MINTEFTYNDLTLNDGNKYHLTSIEGFDDPEAREQREDRATQDGQIDYGQYLGARLMTFNGTILAENATQRDLWRQDLLDAFIKDGVYRWLRWQVSGEVAKQIYCKVFTRTILDNFEDHPFYRNFIINFIAVDPRIYSQTEYTDKVYIPNVAGGFESPLTSPLTSGIAQAGGRLNINNIGNFTSLPVVRMYGPLTNPYIRNNDDGAKQIKINMIVSGGDYLEIDFEEKTIMLNGSASRYNYLDSGYGWWGIKKGNNEIIFRDSGGDTDAYAEVIYRHAWI